MLTRRDQLAMKEEKQRKRKQSVDEKAAKGKEVQPEKKPKRGRTAKNEQAGKEKAELEVEKTEGPKTEKPRRRLRQMKTAKCLPEDPGEQPEPEVPVPEEEPAAPKSKAARKPKSKAKAKAKSQAKAKTEPKKRKAAAKKVEKPQSDLEDCSNDSAEESAMATPKKELFQSEDEGSNGDQDGPAPDHPVHPKPGKKAACVQKALESCVPDAYKASKRQRAKPAVAPRASGPSLENEAEEPVAPKKPRKRKSNSKAKQGPSSKVPLSPFAKKEVKRRKQKEDAVMKSPACEDKQIQAVILQYLKNVEDLTEEDEVKSHLMSSLKDKELNKDFRLNEYWKRPAIGVKVMALGDGSVKNAPEVAYFGRSCIGTCPKQWKFELTVLYTVASLMVLRLHCFTLSQLLCFSKSLSQIERIPRPHTQPSAISEKACHKTAAYGLCYNIYSCSSFQVCVHTCYHLIL